MANLKPCLKCKKKRGPKEFNPKKELYCLACEPLRKSRAAVSIVKVDFSREHARLLTILHRDIQKMMDASHTRLLSKDESSVLIAYLKLISEQKAIKLLEEYENQNGE